LIIQVVKKEEQQPLQLVDMAKIKELKITELMCKKGRRKQNRKQKQIAN